MDQIRVVKNSAKSITQIFFDHDGQSDHIGDIPFGTDQFIPCPDLEHEKGLVAKIAGLFESITDALDSYSAKNYPLAIFTIFRL